MSDATAAGQSFYDLWGKRDFDAMAECLAGAVSFNDAPRNQVINGRSAVREWYAAWADACPDAVAGATLVTTSDDIAVFEGLFTGTNTGPFGPFPASGRSVSLPWINVLRLDTAGRIISGTAYYDQLTLMIQLGHMKPPTGAR